MTEDLKPNVPLPKPLPPIKPPPEVKIYSFEIGISKLELQPGDILVVTLPDKAAEFMRGAWMSRLKNILPEGTKAVVVDHGTDLSILRTEK